MAYRALDLLGVALNRFATVGYSSFVIRLIMSPSSITAFTASRR